MKFFKNFDFLFKPKSYPDFTGIRHLIVNNGLAEARSILRKMPYEEVVAFKLYAENGDAINASIWAEAELQRREFLLNKTALLISLLAITISFVAIFID